MEPKMKLITEEEFRKLRVGDRILTNLGGPAMITGICGDGIITFQNGSFSGAHHYSLSSRIRNIMFFDTETTGLPKNWNAPVTDFSNWPRLVQLAWMIYGEDGELLDLRQTIVKPEGFDIPEQSSNIHGITTDRALSEGRSLLGALEEFVAAVNDCDILVAHNMNYDSKVMGVELLRNNFNNVVEAKEQICTMQSSINYCAIPSSCGFKYPKLSELHIKLFGYGFEGAHDAHVDTKACAQCFFEMLKLGIITI